MESMTSSINPRSFLSPRHHNNRRISFASVSTAHLQLNSNHRRNNNRRALSYRSPSPRRNVRHICCSSSSSSSPSLVDCPVEFKEAAKKGNLIPLYKCIFSDHLTPVLAYRCLVKEDDREAPSFLFESVEPGKNSSVGRYSVVGAQPRMEIVAKENMVTVMDHHKGKITEEFVEDPMTVPKKIMDDWKPQLIDELPDAFCGGWVGYFSYDTVRYVEKKKLPFSSASQDDRNLPDVHLGLYDDVIVFDNVEKKAYVIHWVRVDQYSSTEAAYKDGMKRLDSLLTRVHDIETPKLLSGSIKLQTRLFGNALKVSNMTSEEYKNAVLLAKEHILAGDIFQIVLSQRFERRTFADPFEVYRALRIVNPSPYMAYLQARGCILVASSPEILTRVKKGKVTNRPLAGTVRRGKTPKEDIMMENQLLNDRKQCAEHIMLVDLGRNDVGKVSKFGSVKVEKLMNIERYSHVMHISSTVTGELLDNLTSWDALRAALPVGTVSGAPKVKAMELIDSLEVTRRGPYSGGFGGISFTGDMDIALALRTMVFSTATQHNTMYSYKDANKRREWVAHLQAGAGIVADSVPDDEQKECENKAAGLARAIDLAESSFLEKECASGYRRRSDEACFQMRLSFSPASHLLLFLVQWTDCYLAGALGLLRILIYMSYTDGKSTMFVHEKKASIRQFYGVIFPSLLQLQTGITDVEDQKQKELCAMRYRRYDAHERGKKTELELEIEEECGICMEMNKKIILPNCCHALCFKCYQDWYARSQSCPFCRNPLGKLKPGDLWIYTDDSDIVDLSVTMKENVNRLFNYFNHLPLMQPHHTSMFPTWPGW